MPIGTPDNFTFGSTTAQVEQPNHYTTVYTVSTVNDAALFRAKLARYADRDNLIIRRKHNIVTVYHMDKMTLAERREVYEKVR